MSCVTTLLMCAMGLDCTLRLSPNTCCCQTRTTPTRMCAGPPTCSCVPLGAGARTHLILRVFPCTETMWCCAQRRKPVTRQRRTRILNAISATLPTNALAAALPLSPWLLTPAGPAAREVFQKLLRAAAPPLSRAQLPLSMQVRQKFNVLVRRSVAQSVLRRLQGSQPRRHDAPALELSVALAAAREASWHHQRLASRDAAAAESPRHVFPAASLAPTPALSSRPCAASASAAAPPLAAGVGASSGRDAVAPGPGRGSGVIFAHLGIDAVCPSAHGAGPRRSLPLHAAAPACRR